MDHDREKELAALRAVAFGAGHRESDSIAARQRLDELATGSDTPVPPEPHPAEPTPMGVSSGEPGEERLHAAQGHARKPLRGVLITIGVAVLCLIAGFTIGSVSTSTGQSEDADETSDFAYPRSGESLGDPGDLAAAEAWFERPAYEIDTPPEPYPFPAADETEESYRYLHDTGDMSVYVATNHVGMYCLIGYDRATNGISSSCVNERDFQRSGLILSDGESVVYWDGVAVLATVMSHYRDFAFEEAA